MGSGHGSPQHSTPAKGSFICNAPKLFMSVSWCYWKDRAHMSLEVFLAALRLLELFSKSYSCHSLNCLGDRFPTLGLSEGFWVCLWYSARHDCWDLCLLHTQKPLSRSTDPPSRNPVFPLPPELEEHQHNSRLSRGSAMSSSHLEEGQEKGLYHTPSAPHIPASPACLMGCSCCTQPASLPQCFLPPSCPSRRRHGCRSPSSVTEGSGGCFSIWGLQEARPNQKQWISQEKNPPD